MFIITTHDAANLMMVRRKTNKKQKKKRKFSQPIKLTRDKNNKNESQTTQSQMVTRIEIFLPLRKKSPIIRNPLNVCRNFDKDERTLD